MSAAANPISELNFERAQTSARGTLLSSVLEGRPITVSSSQVDQRKAEQSKPLTTGTADPSPCCALDCLLNDLLSFYVSAEKVHWHLRLNPVTLRSTYHLPERFARDMCNNLLGTLSLIIQMKSVFDDKSDQECAELITMIAAKQSELDAL